MSSSKTRLENNDLAEEKSPLIMHTQSLKLNANRAEAGEGTYKSLDVARSDSAPNVSEVYHATATDSPMTDHCHSTEKQNAADWKARKTLIYAIIICLLFMLAEIIGGSLAGSLAIMTDAAHLLTDFASFMISLFALFVSSRPATVGMSFGWHRAEVLGAVLSVLLIWVVTGVLFYMAVDRIVNKDYEIDAKIMLITAAVGVCVNIIMGLMLHNSGHGHSHGGGGGAAEAGGGHGHSHGTGKSNINVRAAFIHVVGDFIQSLGVLVAAFIIYFYPHLIIIDPICTFLFSVLVLITTITILRDALNVLMEGKPRGMDFKKVTDSLLQMPGVIRAHDIRIWSLTMNKIAFSAHLVIEAEIDAQHVLREASSLLKREYNVYDCTLQVERFTRDMDDCHKCEQPSN